MNTSLLFTDANAPALIWASAAFVISLLLGACVRLHYASLPGQNQRFGARWYGRLMPLIPPVIFVILLTIGTSVFKKGGIDTALNIIITDVALSWFVIAAVHVTTRNIAKTLFAALVIIPYAALSIFGLLKDVTGALSDMSFSVGDANVSAYHIIKFVISIVVLVWIGNAFIHGTEFWLGRLKHMRGNTRQLFNTLTRTAVYITVFLTALSVLGIDLTAFAIFGGALGVGLGFGLQKIASNFISGMILLVERSVDVNDLIEFPVGNILGLVKYTGARYTLIETLDNREVMIPNEDFITQRVINWTFSSPRGLLRIPVIVSYDSDIEKARQLMLEAAKEHPRCLTDPGPACLLTEFNDLSVNFTLLVWIADVREKRLTTQSEIMLAVWHKFRENGVGIPHQARENNLGPKESVGG